MNSNFSLIRQLRDPSYTGGLAGLTQQVQNAANLQQQLAPAPAVNPNSLINPYYMQAQPMDSLAPMSMYQNYKATGQMPAETNSFQSANPQLAQLGSK